MGKHADHLKDLAEAARDNAAAVLNSERVWLVVELVPTAVKINGLRYFPSNNAGSELSESDMSGEKNFEYTLKLTNMGKTRL